MSEKNHTILYIFLIIFFLLPPEHRQMTLSTTKAKINDSYIIVYSLEKTLKGL